MPVYLNDDERRVLEQHLPVNLKRDPPDETDDEKMNIVQAIKNSSRIGADASAPKESRAVHLWWLLHLAGGSHPPLHSCALFTTHRFRDGDQGGNRLEIQHDWKLHAFWDAQISTEEAYKDLTVLATDLDQNKSLAEYGQKASATIDGGAWIDESDALAKRVVYTPEVLQKVAAHEGHPHLGPLDLPASYEAEAESVSERRAGEGAH